MEKYQELFCSIPGKTNEGYHVIPTTGNPVKIPPRRIPAHYRAEVTQQIQTMLEQGIITHSKSPWMAPTVFVPKKSGEVRICIDYCELNKRTSKDCRFLTRYKISWLDPLYFQHLIFTVDIGNCRSVLTIERRQPSALVQA